MKYKRSYGSIAKNTKYYHFRKSGSPEVLEKTGYEALAGMTSSEFQDWLIYVKLGFCDWNAPTHTPCDSDGLK
jgi:hypothetical protein